MYERYVQVLYNYGYKIAQDSQLVEDCLQDVFLALLEYRERLSPTDSIKFYLFRALRREIVRKLRENDRFCSEEEADFRAVFGVDGTWLDGQVARDQIDELLTALNLLPPRQKEAVHLRYFENLSYEEIAGVMGIEQSSAYKVIYKAIDNLQRRFVPAFLLLLQQLTLPDTHPGR
ncbi:RNA polymerase sigma factor [Tellurirhabdus rosea]|uniref:RNA polymerase sigma factor n=1 Tax=Tellurirhabdus rosea TaxID=2674997 RepID=UPI00224EF539|nr:sigma-70 family RNA polymerase sigma factor [Tellurirhabdus rosea]